MRPETEHFLVLSALGAGSAHSSLAFVIARVIGGFAVGVMQHSLSASEAASWVWPSWWRWRCRKGNHEGREGHHEGHEEPFVPGCV